MSNSNSSSNNKYRNSNPQEAETKIQQQATNGGGNNSNHRPQSTSTSASPPSTTTTTNDDNDSFHSKLVVCLFAICVLSPFFWNHVFQMGDSPTRLLEQNRTLSGLPPTWDELYQDTVQQQQSSSSFQVGIPPTSLPRFVLESARGFEMAFLDDGCFYSLQYFLERTGNKDVTTTPWSVPLARTMRKRLGTSATRTLSYLHPVSHPLAPPMARATKSQRFERYSDKAALVQTLTNVQDVPMADAFVVEERLLIETIGAKLQVSAFFRIQFVKPNTMFRSIMEQQTSKEFIEYFHNYQSFLMAIATGQQSVWQPNHNNGYYGDTVNHNMVIPSSDNHNSPTSRTKSLFQSGIPKALQTVILRPLGFLWRQVGKLARSIGHWKRQLSTTSRKEPV
ncbi:protein of unknown function DUF4782 containing protein [Nitzschia inconspicua]|uniref:VASt domain-containing protein n=1 Tax=Nitzschia inconspicua TaxID=303405 RepID=A0A9K3L2J7_9STRA|nr:protein of unknown function DUF4782 containing protein [Nitzschia inconspicua]